MAKSPAEALRLRWQKEDEDALSEAVKALLSTPVGRKFLWHVLDITKFRQQPFTGQALVTSFNCGELNVGLQLQALLEDHPDLYAQFLKGAKDERTRRDAELTAADRASAPGGNADWDSAEE